MNNRTTMMALTVVVLTAAMPAAVADMTDGHVIKVDESAGKITIKHGPMKKFDMGEGMTMVYRVQTPAMLKTIRPGDKIKFDAERVNGQFTVDQDREVAGSAPLAQSRQTQITETECRWGLDATTNCFCALFRLRDQIFNLDQSIF